MVGWRDAGDVPNEGAGKGGHGGHEGIAQGADVMEIEVKPELIINRDICRYLFAGLAMAALVGGFSFSMPNEVIVRQSVELADLLLAELEKKP